MTRSEIQERDVAFAAILETIVDGVVITDASGGIVLMNRAAERMFDRRGAELAGRPLTSAMGGLERMMRTLQSGSVVQGLELQRTRPGSEARTFLVNGAPMRGERGESLGNVVTFADVTDRTRAYAQLEASERRFRELTEESGDMIAYENMDGELVYVSPAAQTILGYAPSEMVGRPSEDFVAPEDRQLVVRRHADTNTDSYTLEFRACRKDGSRRWLDANCRVVRDGDRNPIGFLVIARDATERHAAAEAIRRSAAALATAQEIAHLGSFEDDIAAGTSRWSDELYRIFGVSREDFAVTATSLWQFDHPDDVTAVRHTVETARRERTPYEIEHRIVRPDGEERWVFERGRHAYDEDGTPVALSGTVLDTTERKRAEERAAYLAHHDPLTELPNRIVLSEYLGRTLARAGLRGTHVAVLSVDLDRFKAVNDTFGHAAGDALLKAIAERIRGCMRPGDLLSRPAGDGFLAVLVDLAQADEAARIATQMLGAIAHPVTVDGRNLVVTASIGASLYPNDGLGADQLIRNAEAAMYRVKTVGRGNFQFAEAELQSTARKRLLLEHDLRTAVDNRELRLFYQPLVDADGVIAGCEALLRWNHPAHGMLAPDAFIALAEETGLIISIGTWVMEEACRQAAAWALIAPPRFSVAINISARQLQQAGLLTTIDRLQRLHAYREESIEVEITESTAMRDAELALRLLGEIKERRIKIGIDDFGTGYSSLAYLKRFPLDKLKIDRTFVSGMDSHNGQAIVAAIITLAHSLGLTAVAEGVETVEQLTLLRELCCDQMQGYLFSRPVPPAAFEAMLRARTPLGARAADQSNA